MSFLRLILVICILTVGLFATVTPVLAAPGCCVITKVGMSALGVHYFSREKSACTGPDKQGIYKIIYTFYPDMQPDKAPPAGKACIPFATSVTGGNVPPTSVTGANPMSFSLLGMTNPIRTIQPAVLIGRVVRAILLIIGSIALIMFIYAGFTWMTAAGNDTKITKARNTLVWATLGLIVIFGAYLLTNYVLEAVGAL